MTIRTGVFLGALLLATTLPAAAQDPAAARGDRSIVLDVGGDPSVGYWTRRGDRTDVGISLGLQLDHQDVEDSDRSFASITLTPARKRYLSPRGPLASYAYYGLPLSYGWNSSSNDDNRFSNQKFSVGALAGWGLEWFPAEWVSVGGHIGGRIGASYIRERDEYWNGTEQIDETDTGWGVGLNTLTSGIRAHLYF